MKVPVLPRHSQLWMLFLSLSFIFLNLVGEKWFPLVVCAFLTANVAVFSLAYWPPAFPLLQIIYSCSLIDPHCPLQYCPWHLLFAWAVPTVRLSGWDADLLRNSNWPCLDLLLEKNSPKTSHSTQLLQIVLWAATVWGEMGSISLGRVKRTGVNTSCLEKKRSNKVRINV